MESACRERKSLWYFCKEKRTLGFTLPKETEYYYGFCPDKMVSLATAVPVEQESKVTVHSSESQDTKGVNSMITVILFCCFKLVRKLKRF